MINSDDDINLSNKFSIYLRMGSVESGPPLSTILGNFGINTIKFVKDLNEFTVNYLLIFY